MPHRPLWLAVAGLAGVALVAYHNSFSGPFVFDDVASIPGNASIRDLADLGTVLGPQPEGGETVGGRPLVNLSLALDYAIWGQEVVGYHITNWVIHVLAGLTLFGVVRRMLLQPRLAAVGWTLAWPVALAVAACWLVHPLQTSAVTYVVQRAESLMALCYLATIYGFVRSVAPGASAMRWQLLTVGVCAAGMAAKEVMVSAPLIVWAYDRTFVAGSFGGAWRARKWFYVGLAATWLLLAGLVASTAGRGGTAGFATEVSSWSYLLTQAEALVRYVGLAVWPHPLVFDYGTWTAKGIGDVWWQLGAVAAGLGATVWALVKRPVWGLLGLAFFAILAPSSSVVPVASQTMAEHRMYLPLAVLLGPALFGLYRWLGLRAWVVVALLLVGYSALTIARNRDYQSELTLWADTAAKRPQNARAHNNLGKAQLAARETSVALVHFDEAIRLAAAAPEPTYNRGVALARLGRTEEAIQAYEAALRLQPAYAEPHNALGNVWLAKGQLGPALAHYEQAVALQPTSAEFRSNWANALLESGRGAEAVQAAREAVRLDAGYAVARYNLGSALAQSGALAAALPEFQEAVRLKPDYAEAFNNLANVLLELDRVAEAITAYEQALTLRPDLKPARRNLALVLAHLGRTNAAITHLQILLRLDPSDAQARAVLAELSSGRP